MNIKMSNIDFSIIWSLLNTNIISGIIIFFFGVFVTVKVIDAKRQRVRRITILSILRKELEGYSDPANTAYHASFQFNVSNGYIRGLLYSDNLHYKRDNMLIYHLHELHNWIENFNSANKYANQALISGNNDYLNFFSSGRDDLYRGIYNERNKIIELLDNKYKVEKSIRP